MFLLVICDDYACYNHMSFHEFIVIICDSNSQSYVTAGLYVIICDAIQNLLLSVITWLLVIICDAYPQPYVLAWLLVIICDATHNHMLLHDC